MPSFHWKRSLCNPLSFLFFILIFQTLVSQAHSRSSIMSCQVDEGARPPHLAQWQASSFRSSWLPSRHLLLLISLEQTTHRSATGWWGQGQVPDGGEMVLGFEDWTQPPSWWRSDFAQRPLSGAVRREDATLGTLLSWNAVRTNRPDPALVAFHAGRHSFLFGSSSRMWLLICSLPCHRFLPSSGGKNSQGLGQLGCWGIKKFAPQSVLQKPWYLFIKCEHLMELYSRCWLYRQVMFLRIKGMVFVGVIGSQRKTVNLDPHYKQKTNNLLYTFIQ